MPRTRRNPAAGDTPTPVSNVVNLTDNQQLPTPTISAPTESPYAALDLGDLPLSLPEGFDIQLPDLQEFARSAIGTAETGFAPNPALPRVSDSDREVHAVIFQEQRNAAANLQDSIKVATAYVQAGVEATKLGKGLVRYATGIEEIREAMLNLKGAQVKTAIANEKVNGLNAELSYLTQENTHKLDTFKHKLEQWQERVRGEQLRTQELTHQINTRYGHLMTDN